MKTTTLLSIALLTLSAVFSATSVADDSYDSSDTFTLSLPPEELSLFLDVVTNKYPSARVETDPIKVYFIATNNNVEVRRYLTMDEILSIAMPSPRTGDTDELLPLPGSSNNGTNTNTDPLTKFMSHTQSLSSPTAKRTTTYLI